MAVAEYSYDGKLEWKTDWLWKHSFYPKHRKK